MTHKTNQFWPQKSQTSPKALPFNRVKLRLLSAEPRLLSAAARIAPQRALLFAGLAQHYSKPLGINLKLFTLCEVRVL